MPIPVLTPCKVSLALISAFLVELVQVCCWFQQIFWSFPKNPLCHWRKGDLSLCQVNLHHPSCSLLTTLPVWQNQVSGMELIQPAVECGQPLTQGRCGCRIDPLSICFPIPESSSRKETTPCNQQTRSSRSNQHVWVVLREISVLLYGTLTSPRTQKQIKYFIPEF